MIAVGSVMVLLLNCSCGIFNQDYSFDSFPGIFNVIPIVFKIFCIINLLTLFH